MDHFRLYQIQFSDCCGRQRHFLDILSFGRSCEGVGHRCVTGGGSKAAVDATLLVGIHDGRCCSGGFELPTGYFGTADGLDGQKVSHLTLLVDVAHSYLDGYHPNYPKFTYLVG